MPTVAVIDGIKIRLYWDEHPPPHFHAETDGHIAVFDIQTLKVLAGYLPRSHQRRVVSWAISRRAQLLAAWATCSQDMNPGRIE